MSRKPGACHCVFLGSSNNIDPRYYQIANSLGVEIAKRKLTLIYGGSSYGLMGSLAKSVVQNNGKIEGIITSSLHARETAFLPVQTKIVDTIDERMQVMLSGTDYILVLPGSLGTLEELFKVWNSIKLGIISKPLGILNAFGYFDSLVEFLINASKEGFTNINPLSLLSISDSCCEILDTLMTNKSNN